MNTYDSTAPTVKNWLIENLCRIIFNYYIFVKASIVRILMNSSFEKIFKRIDGNGLF